MPMMTRPARASSATSFDQSVASQPLTLPDAAPKPDTLTLYQLRKHEISRISDPAAATQVPRETVAGSNVEREGVVLKSRSSLPVCGSVHEGRHEGTSTPSGRQRGIRARVRSPGALPFLARARADL